MSDNLRQASLDLQNAPKPPIPGNRRTLNGVDRSATTTPWQVRDRVLQRVITATERVSATAGMPMNVVGQLGSAGLPIGNLGIELAAADGVLTVFLGRRGSPGTIGQTVVELEKNGALTGYRLTWSFDEAAFALKSIPIKLKIKAGDRLSLRILSVEAGAEDLYCLATA